LLFNDVPGGIEVVLSEIDYLGRSLQKASTIDGLSAEIKISGIEFYGSE
jgi:hypothetical protein